MDYIKIMVYCPYKLNSVIREKYKQLNLLFFLFFKGKWPVYCLIYDWVVSIL